MVITYNMITNHPAVGIQTLIKWCSAITKETFGWWQKEQHKNYQQGRSNSSPYPIYYLQYLTSVSLNSGGTFVYAMKPMTYKGKGYNMWNMMYKGKGRNKWKGKGYKGRYKLPPPVPTPPTMPPVMMPPSPSNPPTPLCGNVCRTGCLSITDFVLVDADQPVNVDDPAAD